MNSVMLDLGFIKIYWYSFFILMNHKNLKYQKII